MHICIYVCVCMYIHIGHAAPAGLTDYDVGRPAPKNPAPDSSLSAKPQHFLHTLHNT